MDAIFTPGGDIGHANRKQERAGRHEAEAAVWEAIFGNVTEARQHAAAALGLSTARDVMYGAALAFARTGESARAQALADDLENRFPEDTIARFNYLPTLRQLLDNEPLELIRRWRRCSTRRLLQHKDSITSRAPLWGS